MTNNLKLKEVTLPLLPLRDIVVFPGMVSPLFVGRQKSIKSLEMVMSKNAPILLATQYNSTIDDPKPHQIHTFGVTAHILQLLKLPDGTVKVLVEGINRVEIKNCYEHDSYLVGLAKFVEENFEPQGEVKALHRTIITRFTEFAKLNKKVAPEIISSLDKIEDSGKLADMVCSHINFNLQERQELLEDINIVSRLEKVFTKLESEIEVANAEKKIRTRVKGQIEKNQKEYYLNEQLKAIHKELGEGSEESANEVKLLEQRIKETNLSKEALDKAKLELKKLKTMPAMAAEATVIRNYLDWLLGIPWEKYTDIRSDLLEAEQILNDEHYGLEKVKERILEYIAVQQRVKMVKGSILCLVGPPGVGKTSLAKSIAEAMGRNFGKISLGGVRDESEIRGHRRTYIGSMPGKIIQTMKKTGSSNPLLLLDEIDKMGLDFRGDPASALLEILDSEQNDKYNDHYIEVDYNLSKVVFVATANSTNLPHALLDRLEIIRLSGYTEEEKIEICNRHLIPKLKLNHGLVGNELNISDEAISCLIKFYTREAGVRNLEREIANLARKAVREILSKKITKLSITSRNLHKYAGVRKFVYGQTEKEDMAGIVNGLAYTEFGGDILTIEALQLPGKGDIKCTGKLGDVMQESAQAAFSYAKSRAPIYGISPDLFKKKDIHIHVPEGATPKDGPSAGITMFTSIVSVMTGIPISRNVAMTGEITLRGRVLPIGGLKEKLLAALRSGVQIVLVPKENQKDMAEIPTSVKNGLKIVYVSHADEVLKYALTKMPTPIEWNEEEINAKIVSSDNLIPDSGNVIKH